VARVADDRRLVQRPDDLLTFRVARLMLLLDVTATLELKKPLDIERLGFYDFFAANPFLVIGEDEAARRAFILAGFSSYDLSYQSSGHRFANRRARLRNDLAMLIAYGATVAAVEGQRVVYQINERGQALVGEFQTLYASAYRASAEVVVARLDRLSDKRLREDAKRWLNDDRLLIDLYDVGDDAAGAGMS
jgi:hypothetical protein